MSQTVHAEINYCPTCRTEVEPRTGGYYCPNCQDTKAITATVVADGDRS